MLEKSNDVRTAAYDVSVPLAVNVLSPVRCLRSSFKPSSSEMLDKSTVVTVAASVAVITPLSLINSAKPSVFSITSLKSSFEIQISPASNVGSDAEYRRVPSSS